jgi:hypothetical protein
MQSKSARQGPLAHQVMYVIVHRIRFYRTKPEIRCVCLFLTLHPLRNVACALSHCDPGKKHGGASSDCCISLDNRASWRQ